MGHRASQTEGLIAMGSSVLSTAFCFQWEFHAFLFGFVVSADIYTARGSFFIPLVLRLTRTLAFCFPGGTVMYVECDTVYAPSTVT